MTARRLSAWPKRATFRRPVRPRAYLPIVFNPAPLDQAKAKALIGAVTSAKDAQEGLAMARGGQPQGLGPNDYARIEATLARHQAPLGFELQP
jgi:hypothetical protein